MRSAFFPLEPSRVFHRCDGCAEWFHPLCVGLSEDCAGDLETFQCAQCAQQRDPAATATAAAAAVTTAAATATTTTTTRTATVAAPAVTATLATRSSDRHVAALPPSPSKKARSSQRHATTVPAPLSASSRRGSARRPPSSKLLFCVCRQPENADELYIQCDGCEQWFHPRCVGLQPDAASDLATFQCAQCAQQREEDPTETLDGLETESARPRRGRARLGGRFAKRTEVLETETEVLETETIAPRWQRRGAPEPSTEPSTERGRAPARAKSSRRAASKEPDVDDTPETILFCVCRQPENDAELYIQSTHTTHAGVCNFINLESLFSRSLAGFSQNFSIFPCVIFFFLLEKREEKKMRLSLLLLRLVLLRAREGAAPFARAGATAARSGSTRAASASPRTPRTTSRPSSVQPVREGRASTPSRVARGGNEPDPPGPP